MRGIALPEEGMAIPLYHKRQIVKRSYHDHRDRF